MVGGKKEVLHIEADIEQQFTKKTKEYLQQKWYKTKPVLGVASGGVYPGLVSQIMKAMGNNIVLQAGGGIHGHPQGTRAGAIAMRQAVDAVMKHKTLKDYSKNHEELKEVLGKFGYPKTR